MHHPASSLLRALFLLLCVAHCTCVPAQTDTTDTYRVVAFYTARHDKAHISFVHEATAWLAEKADSMGYHFEATADWDRLDAAYLANKEVVIFLDTRPEVPAQRAAFEAFVKRGGGWMGFHFSAFALSPSDYPDDWPWYQDTLLGCGAYRSNTWKPTSAILRVEDADHPVTQGVAATIASSPNEWYRWDRDLRDNPDIDILLAIDPASFPLGTGPKPQEIWHAGYYPVVWTNRRYRMVYFNMGHNDIDYAGGTDAELSFTFGNAAQDRLVLNALRWLGGR